MKVIEIKEWDKNFIIEVELMVDKPDHIGKIYLSPRWKAASKSLLNYLGKQGTLVEI